MNLYQELQEKLNEHNPSEVDDLILDDLFENVKHFSEQNKADLEKYSNLVHLSLNGFGLTSLKNFPKIEGLKILEIRSNNLDGSDLGTLTELYPELYKLKLGENPIKDLNNLKGLANSELVKIELQDTPAAEAKDYRNTVYEILPKIEVVDGVNKNGDDVTSTFYDDEEGEMDEDDINEDDEGEDDEFEEYEDEEDEDDVDGESG